MKIERIGVCEECLRIFTPEEVQEDVGRWHKCKMKNYKKEHRCESYIAAFQNMHAHISIVQSI